MGKHDRVYTTARLEKLLSNYLDIRATLNGRSQQLHDMNAIETNDARPMSRRSHSKAPQNGKGRARMMEDLHVSCIDIEENLPKLLQDDRQLIMDYHILHRMTLDELCVSRGNKSRGSMQRRIQRAVTRLVDVMEHKYEQF
jgi:hypothetical protein